MPEKQGDIQYVDAHTHQRTGDVSVIAIRNLIVGHDPESPEAVPFCSVGAHPWYWRKADMEQLRAWSAHPSVKAIGECGLDRLTDTPLDEQWPVFRQQIALSEAVRKPLIIHCVRAFPEIVAEHKAQQPTQPWILHGFNNRSSFLNMVLDAGLYVSLGAALLRGDSPASAAIARIPADRLLLETDDKPLPVSEVYQAAASRLGWSLAQLAAQVRANAGTVFGV
ncbi:TatD family hydrolase [Arsenicibacter rosenii]|uniref:Hydrolase TatD n=1 Tax=Arsenicibacter rosenii TaxID=1750698 RepID=A0A1S2VNS8_9BACT|nr:TatD family hydrolase [Arsenicibacter rosenii]OIN60423.1 hypothetical protein BLX24_06265 [Arsenicibacter rosenii]